MSLQSLAGARGAPPPAIHPVSPADARSEGRSPTAEGRARVLLVENHPVYAAGLKALLADDPTIEVVGHATDSAGAMPLVRYYQPDLILLDIGLGEESGLDLITRFRRIAPNTRIAIITAREERECLMTALRLGVQAFIQKDMPGETITSAVRQVLAGERVVPQAAAMTVVLTEFGELLQDRERERCQLTSQELNIMRLAAAGYKNKDIGAHEFLSEVTIKRKLQDVYRKLSVSGKPAAVAKAMQMGLI